MNSIGNLVSLKMPIHKNVIFVNRQPPVYKKYGTNPKSPPRTSQTSSSDKANGQVSEMELHRRSFDGDCCGYSYGEVQENEIKSQDRKETKEEAKSSEYRR